MQKATVENLEILAGNSPPCGVNRSHGQNDYLDAVVAACTLVHYIKLFRGSLGNRVMTRIMARPFVAIGQELQGLAG